MKIRVALVIAFSLLAAHSAPKKFSLVGATVINPADAKCCRMPRSLINGDKIERVRWANRTLPLSGNK